MGSPTTVSRQGETICATKIMLLFVESIAVIVVFLESNARDVAMKRASRFGQLKFLQAYVLSMIVAVIKNSWSIADCAKTSLARSFWSCETLI